ncbi:MAG: O-antigen ligase family protein [Candidatus Omnitrophica bacterium]|nr:O-antigen ligase family protein [Candidatus Omnitrophota bacterium]
MSYIIIVLLGLRPFICEQANASLAILFDIFFLSFFLLYILLIKNFQIKKPVFFLSLIFPFFIMLSNFFSVNSYNSEAELLRVFVLVLIFNFVYFQNKKQRNVLIAGMLSISAIICLRALYQYFSGIDFIRNSQTFDQLTKNGFYAWELLLQKRVVSWFASPNILGGYLIAFCPLACVYLFKSIGEKNKKATVLFSFLCLALFLSVLLTKTISVFLSFILSMIFLFTLLSRGKKTGEMNKAAGIILTVFFVCLLGLFLKRGDSFFDFKNPQNSFSQRVYYWQSGLKMISEHPVAGIGAGNFRTVYPRFKNANANETIYTHNSYIQIWAESGFAALAFFLLFVFIVFRSALKRRPEPIDAGIIAGCFAVLLHNFTDYSLFVNQSGHIWWILLGCVLSGSEHDLKIIERSTRQSLFLRMSYLIFSIFLLFNAFLFYQSERSIKESVMFFKNRQFNSSIISAYKALRCKPNNDLAYYILARNFRVIEVGKLSPKALNNYKQAISLNKNYAFYYFELAEYFFSHNKIDSARRFIRLAIKFYPQNSKFQALNSSINKLKSK